MSDFEKELGNLINKHSIENESNTPDWLLAQYLMSCLAAFTTAIQQRETYYRCDPKSSLRTEIKDNAEIRETVKV